MAALNRHLAYMAVSMALVGFLILSLCAMREKLDRANARIANLEIVLSGYRAAEGRN